MKGLAPAHTLTGQVQRQLENWTTASTVMARLGLPPKQYRTVEALLERLVKEGRAEKRDGEYRSVLPEADATHDAGDGAVADPSASASGRTLRRTQEAMEPSPASLGASVVPTGALEPPHGSSPAGEVPSGASPVSQLALDIQVRRVA